MDGVEHLPMLCMFRCSLSRESAVYLYSIKKTSWDVAEEHKLKGADDIAFSRDDKWVM